MTLVMRLEKTSSATLIAWILFATMLLAVFVMLLVISAASVAFVYALFIGPLSVLIIATAWMLDDSTDPVLVIDEKGMTLSTVFSTGERIPWADIDRVTLVAVRHGLFQIAVLSHLVIQLRDTSYVGGAQWLSPASWTGRIMIPARFIKGGRSAARRAVQAAQTGLLQGEIDRDRRAAGTDDLLRAGDAAIARAVAARGGFGGFQAQPRTMADLGGGADVAALPQAYEPDAAPTVQPELAMPQRPAAPPAPIMVNGVPYQPQRPGGFGRKR